MKKLVIVALSVLFLGLLGLKVLGKKPEKFSTAKVKRTELTQIVSASGKTKSQNQVDLKFQTSGKLIWVGVKEGDFVQKWQAISQLDTGELQKTLEKYLRDYSKQRNDFEETFGVTYKGQKPEQALTDTAKRILEKNQWDLDKAVLDVELKDISLKLATLITPIEGIVTHIDTPVAGVNITPAGAIFTIADSKTAVFSGNIDEADIGQLRLGQKTQVILDSYPEEKFEGEVIKIGFSSVATSGGGTAFPVEVSLPPNENLKFKIGMNGDVEILTQKKDNVLVVPSSSIFTKDGKNFVWKVVFSQAKKQEIIKGVESQEKTEILSGLNENDEVISQEVTKIKEGQKINLK